jgi:nicotinamide mononucleotide (NMN) deamidase PncC
LRSPRPIAHVPTPIAGSSDVADRRFVNYASAAKSEMLEIPSDLVLTAAALRSLSPGMIRQRSAHSP